MYIHRKLEEKITQRLLHFDDIIILYGARQVGKTTLINKVLQKLNKKFLRINAEESIYNSVFSQRNLQAMKELTQGYEILFIDEAQVIENISINIKILHDAVPELKIILSGSSSFELANKIQEPLTGRTKTYLLYPIAVCELNQIYNRFELKQLLPDLLIYGAYPKIFNLPVRQDKISHLLELSSAYLYKDIFQLAHIKYSHIIRDLLKLLAFQVGSPVSIHELAITLKISSETVERYIDLLEKSFVVFRLSAFSRNLRKEIKKKDKIYFYDVGIRNAIINNFSNIDYRNDIGQLWENFIIVERLKKNVYNEMHKNIYYWRTFTGAELDFVEEYDGKLTGFEIKWGKKIPKPPKTWLQTYTNARFEYINRGNFLDFIL